MLPRSTKPPTPSRSRFDPGAVRNSYEPVLKKSRWCLLKRPANLTDNQRVKLRDVLRYNLASVRAYLLKEAFQSFWEYDSPVWAGKFLDEWTQQVMRSRIEPMKKFARTIRAHRELLLNYFRARKAKRLGAAPDAVLAEVLSLLDACVY